MDADFEIVDEIGDTEENSKGSSESGAKSRDAHQTTSEATDKSAEERMEVQHSHVKDVGSKDETEKSKSSTKSSSEAEVRRKSPDSTVTTSTTEMKMSPAVAAQTGSSGADTPKVERSEETNETSLQKAQEQKPLQAERVLEKTLAKICLGQEGESFNIDEIDWSDIRVIDEYDEEKAKRKEARKNKKLPRGEQKKKSSTSLSTSKTDMTSNADKGSKGGDKPRPTIKSGMKPNFKKKTGDAEDKRKDVEKKKEETSAKPIEEGKTPTDSEKKSGEEDEKKVTTSEENGKPGEAKSVPKVPATVTAKDNTGQDTTVSSTKPTPKPEDTAKPNQELEPKREKPKGTVAAYVDSLIGLEYDVKKYTCFYCQPCHCFLTTTPQWEEHITASKHRKNVCRWRECLELKAESRSVERAKMQSQVDNYSECIVGADNVVEVMDREGNPKYWVCVLCSAVCSCVELLLGHLTSFLHIDNHLERMEPSFYRPPGKDDRVLNNVRFPNTEYEAKVLEEARSYEDRRGKGKMQRYEGSGFQQWKEEQPENEELEESLAMDKMAQLFADESIPTDYPIKYKMLGSGRSIANADYSLMTVDSSNTMIGMQYMLEAWAPSRRVCPVYYCVLCGYLVTNWVVHCTILKHCAAYLMKHYKSVYDCVLLESSSEEEFRRVLALAREKVLLLEGRQARVCHVVQLKADRSDVFVAINAHIAKRIVEKEKLEIPAPPRAKKRGKVPIKPSQAPAGSKKTSTTEEERKKSSKSFDSRKRGDSKVSSVSSSSKSFKDKSASSMGSKHGHGSSTHRDDRSGSSKEIKRPRSRSRERQREEEAKRRRMEERRRERERPRPSQREEDRPRETERGGSHGYRMGGSGEGPVREQKRVESPADRDYGADQAQAAGGDDMRLTQADLDQLEEMLKSVVGLDLGRRLTVLDLAMLRGRLGDPVVDSLLDIIKAQRPQQFSQRSY